MMTSLLFPDAAASCNLECSAAFSALSDTTQEIMSNMEKKIKQSYEPLLKNKDLVKPGLFLLISFCIPGWIPSCTQAEGHTDLGGHSELSCASKIKYKMLY